MARRRPEFEPGFAGAEAAKLKKFSDLGGTQFSGCPTMPKPIFESRAVYIRTGSGIELYTNELKSWEFDKKAPSIYASLNDAEAAKLKKFSDAGGRKLSGCSTQSKTNFSVHLCIYILLKKIPIEEPELTNRSILS